MNTLAAVLDAFSAHGVGRAYYKPLAANDNTKNQIYLGGDYSALQMLPFGEMTTDSSTRGGSVGRPRFKCGLSMSWLSEDGGLFPAPEAKLILYPKYPEVRLSGFLKGCERAPSELMASRAPGRVLLLGVTNSATIIAYVAGADHPVAKELLARREASDRMLSELRLELDDQDSRDRVIAELRRIHHAGWIDSKRLGESGALLPCDAPNCGGYTLEAELGIRPNGFADPDFLGWEVKQVAVRSFARPTGVLTLMTPEPDGGYYREHGVEAFIRKFGYADRVGREDRLNFGGIHRFGKRVTVTGLSLELPGYDPTRRKIVDVDGGIALLADDGVEAARWSFVKLMKHWRHKHAKAVYVPSMLRQEPHRQYSFGPSVHLGTGSDFLMLLHGIASSAVYLDPGIKLEHASTPHPRTKRRSQFRVKFSGLKALYRQFECVDVA